MGHAQILIQRQYQQREHDAWLDVGMEFAALGLNMNEGGNAVELHNAIVRWGEELAQLRLNDPEAQHAVDALARRRQLYPGTDRDQ